METARGFNLKLSANSPFCPYLQNTTYQKQRLAMESFQDSAQILLLRRTISDDRLTSASQFIPASLFFNSQYHLSRHNDRFFEGLNFLYKHEEISF